MKRILVATDGSEHALTAAQLAAELAAGMGAEPDILAVAYPMPSSFIRRLRRLQT